MSPGPTFDRVYASLKEQLLGGRWAPGAHLEPAVIGEGLSASITPVRDALYRLVGEGLIDAPRHDGFWVPSMTETQLQSLYAWNGDLMGWALRRTRAPYPAQLASEATGLEAHALFRQIARAADFTELEQAIAASSDRLAEYRTVENEVLDEVADELARIAASLAAGDRDGLRRQLAAYHRRRQRAAPSILAARRRAIDPGGRP